MILLKCLLDTNILSEPIRPEPIQHVLEKLEQHLCASCAFCVISNQRKSGQSAFYHVY